MQGGIINRQNLGNKLPNCFTFYCVIIILELSIYGKSTRFSIDHHEVAGVLG